MVKIIFRTVKRSRQKFERTPILKSLSTIYPNIYQIFFLGVLLISKYVITGNGSDGADAEGGSHDDEEVDLLEILVQARLEVVGELLPKEDDVRFHERLRVPGTSRARRHPLLQHLRPALLYIIIHYYNLLIILICYGMDQNRLRFRFINNFISISKKYIRNISTK